MASLSHSTPEITHRSRNAMAAGIRTHNFVRRPGPGQTRRIGHREWFHFVIQTDRIDLLLNLSLVDDMRPAATTHERARVLMLARLDGKWVGLIDEVTADAVSAPSGGLDLQLGSTKLGFDGNGFRLVTTACDGQISCDLVLEPEAFPSITTDVRAPTGACFNWFVTPRLRANGTVVIRGKRLDLKDAPAYHDHNWGHFGLDQLSWEWAHAHDAANQTAMVLATLREGQEGPLLQQCLFVWQGIRIARIFRNDDLSLTGSGFLRRCSLVLPPICSLLTSRASDIPAKIALRAEGDSDHLLGSFTLEDSACLALGDDANLRTTLLYETLGKAELHGTILGRPFELAAPLILETMRRT